MMAAEPVTAAPVAMRDRVAAVHARICEAAAGSGRLRSDVEIMLATKTQDAAAIRQAQQIICGLERLSKLLYSGAV